MTLTSIGLDGIDPPKGIVLDLDGTLIDNAPLQVVAWRAGLLAAGIDLPTYLIRTLIGVGRAGAGAAIQAATGQALTADAIGIVSDERARTYGRLEHLAVLLPGAQQLVDLLRARTIPTAIVTGTPADEAQATLSRLDLGEVPIVSTATSGIAPKPAPDGLLAAATQLGLPASALWAVGDTGWDMQAARAAQAPAVGVLTGGITELELVAAGAVTVFTDVAAIARYLTGR